MDVLFRPAAEATRERNGELKCGAYLVASLDGERRPAKEIRGQFEAQIQGHVLAKFRVSRGLVRRVAGGSVARDHREKSAREDRAEWEIEAPRGHYPTWERDQRARRSRRERSAPGKCTARSPWTVVIDEFSQVEE